MPYVNNNDFGYAVYASTSVYGGGNNRLYKFNNLLAKFEDTGIALGLSGCNELDVAPNGDIWFTVWGTGIKKIPAGTTTVVDVHLSAANWFGICCAPNGDVYAGVSNAASGDVYKSVGGVGAFTATGLGPKNIAKITASPTGDIWACHFGGHVYKLTGGTGAWVAYPDVVTRNWYAITVRRNGDVFGGVAYGATNYIHRLPAGSSTWEVAAAITKNWYGLGSDRYGNIWAVEDGQKVWFCPANIVSFFEIPGQPNRFYTGIRSNIWQGFDN